MKDIIYIYSLDCPISGTPKYIGKTHDINYRFKQGHLKDKDRSKKTSWIINLKNKGLIPKVTILDEVVKSEWKF